MAEKKELDKQSLINETTIKEEAIRIRQSDYWFYKLNQLLPIGTFVSDSIGLQEQHCEYKKTLVLFKSYNAETFEFGKKNYLLKKEAEVESMLSDFPIHFVKNANIIAELLTYTLKHYYEFLLNNQAWRNQQTLEHKPQIISQRDMNEFEIKTANIISLFSSKTDALKKLIRQLDILKVENLKRKEVLETFKL